MGQPMNLLDTMGFERIQHERLYERVLEQVKRLIEQGNLKPGDRLPSERELATRIGLSRASLREAFRVLEVQGIVESKPGGGRYIRRAPAGLTVGDPSSLVDVLRRATVLDFLDAREVMEPGIVALAVQRATEADLEAIRQALSAGTTPDHLGADQSFHLKVAGASHNVVFYQSLKLYLTLLRDFRARTLERKNGAREMHLEHEAIYLGIKERNADKAVEAMKRHLAAVRTRARF